MDEDEIRSIDDIDKIKEVLLDYRKRFRMINEIMMSYGTISNDDLIGLIAKMIPPDCQ